MAALSAFTAIGRGLLGAAIGLAIGWGLALLLGALTGREDLTQVIIAVGYLVALIGWLLGVGVWSSWAREWLRLPTMEPTETDWRRYFRFSLDHKVIGTQYLVTFVVLMLLAGALSMLVRVELAAPGEDLMDPVAYNTVMGLHGIMMVAVGVATITGGLANYLVPLMIGAEDVAFPRVNALSYWIVPPVAILLILTPFFGGFDSGWTAYPPLSVVNANGQLLFLLAFLTFGLSSIFGGLNFTTTILKLRAPGMTLMRMPIFVWSVLGASLIAVTATQFVAFGLLMVILDRVVGTSFFDASKGGDPLLYEHIFWFYSHPAVYVMILPGFGIELEVVSHFSRKPLFGYKYVVGSILAIVFLSMIVWAHHLFTSGMQEFLLIPFMAATELISIPTGVIFLAALGTMWRGRLRLTTPMLFALGVVFNFLIGGVTGIFLADVPTDIHLQENYFTVAHFHYTIMGGEIFMIMAGLYYWFPKITGRMYSETLGKIHFVTMFAFFQLTFIPMFWVGMQGMNRRVADYDAEFGDLNQIISIMSYLLGASFIVMVINMVRAWFGGKRAAGNPWGARTLEWQTTSPPPVENFDEPQRVTGDPYGYGTPGAPAHSGPMTETAGN